MIFIWLLTHPMTVPAIILAFLIGGIFGAYLQFREDEDNGTNEEH